MKKWSAITKTTSLLLAGAILISGCASTTMIQSSPDGAKLYLNGEPVGTTPYSHTDTKIVGSTNTVKLELQGYEPLNASFSRNEEVDAGAIIGGLLFIFPFLWTMKYKPFHNFELVPLSGVQTPVNNAIQQNQTVVKSKADRLRELKQLFDDKILTQEEYDKEKAKVLAEEEK